MNFLSGEELLRGGATGLPIAVERALWYLGFVDVRVVDGAGDDGADLLAVRDGEQWIFQCKWSSRGAVDRQGVDDLERAFTKYQAEKAVLVTNTGLTKSALERRQALQGVGIKITVWDGPTLEAIWRRMPNRVPNAYRLRDYQGAAVAAVERDLHGQGRALLVLATGLGKTVVGGEVISRFLENKPGASVLVTAHTKELVAQLEKAMWRHIDKATPTRLATGDTKPKTYDGVVIGTVETALGAVQAGFEPALVMVDETHHVGEQGMFARLLDLCSSAAQLGVTATPWRGDKFDITARFGTPSFTMGIAEGMANGFLSTVDYRLYVDNIDWDVVRQASKHGYSVRELNRVLFLPQRDEEIVERLRTAWRRTTDPRAIVFCQTIEHAERIATMLTGADALWRRATCLHSGVPRQRRQVLLNEFRLGRVPIMTCVDIFNEGVDVPDVNLIAFLRVTHSRRIFVQQLGRGLRLSPGKDSLRVLDFVSDIRRVAATLELRRSLEAEAEYLRIRKREGTGVTFSDKTAGKLLDHWIEDAADLETAADEVRLQFPPFEGSF
ncbi:DNA/RNA helicase, DEAD/DEAH box type [Actinokineospora spheciospongiae]|uniref:DNA/RNA helicase, DEAD/DEAH box type n=1 Tax=Actinokineospora spheciospongiae TaxID=909613 RepID=W7ITL4_9PSEU|nr:DEAD/DEAH box helicase family protein [Actinokineospora spheciospongiae]EWC60077.1 DNA/RNA helicase, DEAD/DEAH box type [Actinokineospora spheciospongiae]